MKTIIGHDIALFFPDDQAFMLHVTEGDDVVGEEGFYVMACADDVEQLGGPYQESLARLVMSMAAQDLASGSLACVPAIERRIDREASRLANEVDAGEQR